MVVSGEWPCTSSHSSTATGQYSVIHCAGRLCKRCKINMAHISKLHEATFGFLAAAGLAFADAFSNLRKDDMVDGMRTWRCTTKDFPSEAGNGEPSEDRVRKTTEMALHLFANLGNFLCDESASCGLGHVHNCWEEAGLFGNGLAAHGGLLLLRDQPALQLCYCNWPWKLALCLRTRRRSIFGSLLDESRSGACYHEPSRSFMPAAVRGLWASITNWIKVSENSSGLYKNCRLRIEHLKAKHRRELRLLGRLKQEAAEKGEIAPTNGSFRKISRGVFGFTPRYNSIVQTETKSVGGQ